MEQPLQLFVQPRSEGRINSIDVASCFGKCWVVTSGFFGFSLQVRSSEPSPPLFVHDVDQSNYRCN